MITKRISLWISLALGAWLITAALVFMSRQHIEELGIFSSGLLMAPIVLPLLPFLILRTNTAYEESKLSLATSIMQIIFFALCGAFGAMLLFGADISFSGIALGLAIVTLLAIAIKAAFAKRKDGKKDPKKLIITLLAFAVAVWLPVSLFVNPGWGSLLLFTPYVLIALVPLFVLLANASAARKTSLPVSIFVIEIIFLLLWASLGFLYVNGGDTDESIGSLASELLGGIWGRDFLIQLSPIAMKFAVWSALALLPYIFLYRQGKSILFKVLPLGVTLAAIAFCLWTPFGDDAGSRKQVQPLEAAYNAIQKDIINPVGGKSVRYEAAGVGLGGQLKCSHTATCPSIKASWAVPVDKDKDWDFIWSVVQSEGYNNPDPVFPCFPRAVEGAGCRTWGLKSGSEVHISIQKIDSSKAPSQDVSPKIWRLVEVEITPYSNSYVPDRKGEVHTLDELNFSP